MRSLIVAGLLTITSAAPNVQAAAPAAPAPEPSLMARVFHAPKPEAVGAAIGGVVAVQVAQRWRGGKGRKGPGGR